MPRFTSISLVFLVLFVAIGCGNSSRRGIGGVRGGEGDTGTMTDPDAGTMDPDASDEDATVPEDTSTPPPPSCDDGFTECGGMCVDTFSDDFHCGGCDIVCSGGYCEEGTCVEDGPTCPSPRVMCGESCADTQTNRDHCGGCFSGCTGDEACRSGRCVSTCTPSCGGAECGSDGCGGSCGTCGSGTTCTGGYCEPVPPPTGSGESCATASPIFSSTTFTFSGRAADHTPFSCGTTSSRPDAVYAYTAIASGSVTITASGASGADTMLAVYDGSPCTSSYEVACNDDSPTSGGYDSEVTFTASVFTTYYIVVAPYSSTTPTDTITLTVAPSPTP